MSFWIFDSLCIVGLNRLIYSLHLSLSPLLSIMSLDQCYEEIEDLEIIVRLFLCQLKDYDSNYDNNYFIFKDRINYIYIYIY